MDEDGLRIFDREIDVAVTPPNRMIGMTFVATVTAAVLFGLFALVLLAGAWTWFAQNVLARAYFV